MKKEATPEALPIMELQYNLFHLSSFDTYFLSLGITFLKPLHSDHSIFFIEVNNNSSMYTT